MTGKIVCFSFASALLAYSQAGLPSGRGAPFGGRFKTYEQAAVARGFPLYQSNCASCHGDGARGTKTGPDLIRASVTLHDTDGVQISEALKTSAHQNAVKVTFSSSQLYDIAALLHGRVMDASGRGQVHTADVLVGNARAGEAYFSGAGRCSTCHSITGDLKGIGGKFDAPTLQERIVMPPRTAGKGIPANSLKATVTPATGPPVTGALLRVTDFDVILRLADGTQQSWTRNRGVPKVDTTDPLQAHFDIMKSLKDADMHNVTAYLAGVK